MEKYIEKAHLLVDVKKVEKERYIVTGIKNFNGLSSKEIVLEMNYAFENDKKMFANEVEDCACKILKNYGIKMEEYDNKISSQGEIIGKDYTEESIDKALDTLKKKFGKRLVVKDLNSGNIFIDDNNVATMSCLVTIENI